MSFRDITADSVTARQLPIATIAAERLRIESTPSIILKRVTDILLGLPLLLILAPLLLVLLVVNTIATKGHPVFRQVRVGRGGRPIRVYKLRSMAVDAEDRLRADPELYAKYLANGHKLPQGEDPRVTALGRFLRRTSLDEIPQLWCVAVGSMSLVGPRPVLTDELEFLYDSHRGCYLSSKPGLTGIWQVSGRSAIVGEERVALDCDYVRNWTFLGDLGVLLRTIPAVLFSRGSH